MLPLADVFRVHHPERLQRERERETQDHSHRGSKVIDQQTSHTCRVFSRRPFRKMGKLTKLLYLVTTSAKQTEDTYMSFFSKHVMFMSLLEVCRPLTRSSDENSLQSSLRWSTILVPWRTPDASAISNTPELQTHKTQLNTKMGFILFKCWPQAPKNFPISTNNAKAGQDFQY